MRQDEKINFEKIEDLIIGSGADDFRALERLVDVFCPFEAIGMVSQEIRHAHYLTYILDPNKPHGFGDAMLQGFLELVAEGVAEGKGENPGFSKMDLHLWDGTKATVRREWRDIDLLIELPTPNGEQKGLVVAVELKINAKESDTQLGKYEKIVETEYNDWTRVFVFLTKNNDQASEGHNETWQPMGLGTLIDRLKDVTEHQGFSGPSAELFMAYEAMLRRRHMENNELGDLARKLWSKHEEALELLYEYKPDYLGDLMAELRKKQVDIAGDVNKKLVESKSEITVVTDKSSAGILRFSVKSWDGLYGMDAGTKEWLESGRLIAIELFKTGGNLKTSLVIGPSGNKLRSDLYREICKRAENDGRLSSTNTYKVNMPKNWAHLSSTSISSKGDLSKHEKGGTLISDLADSCIKKFVTHWVKTLPAYDALIREMDGEAARPE